MRERKYGRIVVTTSGSGTVGNFGQSNYGNGAYAILQFSHDGDLIFNSVGGPFRIPLR